MRKINNNIIYIVLINMSVRGPTNKILYWCILKKIRFKQMHIFNKYIRRHRNKVGMVRTKKKRTYLVFRKMISANKRTMALHYYDFNLMQTKVNKNNANCNSSYTIINNTMYFQLFFKEKNITKNNMYINVSLLSIYI